MSRQHLIENYTVSGDHVRQIALTESNRVVEKNGKKYKCRAAYEFPVWRLDKKNLNERVYSKKLAEKVIKSSPVTHGLMNHPKDEDVNVEKIFCVERNPHIKDGIMWIDAYLVGDHGQHVQEIIEAGGQVGLSSSAYGDVDDKGNVMEEEFEIERYADFVDAPSYEVFATSENALEMDEQEEKKQPVQFEDFNPTITNKVESNSENRNLKENIMADNTNKKLSIEEKNLQMGVKRLFKEAESTDVLREKIDTYKQIIEYCEGVDFAQMYVEDAESKITEINDELQKLAEKAKENEEKVSKLEEENKSTKENASTMEEKLQESETALKEITEKYDVAVDLLDNLKMRERKLKEMYEVALAEKNGMISASEYKELQLYTEELEEEIEKLKERLIETRRKNKVRTTRKNRPKRYEKDDETDDTEDDDEEMDDDEDEKEEKGNYKKSKKKKESVRESVDEDDGEYRFVRNNVDVINYYEDLLEENPAVEKIKEEILRCGTLMEAQKTYLNFKDLVEDYPTPYSFTLKNYERLSEEKEQRKEKKPVNFSTMIREGWE